MSWTPLSLAGFQVILSGRFWVIAEVKTGVSIAEGQRFGLHNLRHSLSNWLVSKAKVPAQIVQSLLRHAQIKTTLGLYTQEDGDETQAAQGEFLAALGMKSGAIQ
jgi:integrase